MFSEGGLFLLEIKVLKFRAKSCKDDKSKSENVVFFVLFYFVFFLSKWE